MDLALPFPEDRHAKISAIHSYWRSLPTSAGLPSRGDLDPGKIVPLLPHVWLIDVLRPALRFRYRLVGTGVVEARGYDQTGTFLDQSVADFYESQTYADLTKALDGRPVWRRGVPDKAHRLNDICSLERIFLPLAADGRTVDMVLALTIFEFLEHPGETRATPAR